MPLQLLSSTINKQQRQNVNGKSLSSIRAVTISIMVIYVAVLFDIYERYNGIDYWVVLMVFTPLHVLFILAKSEYPVVKWLLCAVGGVILVLLTISYLHPPFSEHFYLLALSYMINMLVLLIVAGLSLMAASDES